MNNGFPLQNNASPVGTLSSVPRTFGQDCTCIYLSAGNQIMHLSVSSPRGGGGCWATHGNMTVTYIPGVGILIGHHAFDLLISNSRREVNHLFLLILTIYILPRGGKISKSPPYT